MLKVEGLGSINFEPQTSNFQLLLPLMEAAAGKAISLVNLPDNKRKNKLCYAA
jgi:hypothetical protein